MKSTSRLAIAITVIGLILGAGPALAQCAGFSTDPADFGASNVDLLPFAGRAMQTLTRGGVDYYGQLGISTSYSVCPFVGYENGAAVPTLCDFSGPATATPVAGSELSRWGATYIADSGLNPFQLTITLASGQVDSWTASAFSGYIGYCSPAGDPIASLGIIGHDGAIWNVFHDTGGGGSDCSLESLEQDITALDASWDQGLLAKLLAATAMIERGKTIPAINQLGALINQLEAKRDNGQLDLDKADELIACVQEILDGLE